MKSTSPPGSFQLTSCFLPLAESMPEGTISAVCCLNAHPSLNLRHVGEFVDALPMTTAEFSATNYATPNGPSWPT
jgi:hypothetical protein